jgi:NADPH-dependent glutamate synthase beta subunit-like oxidoreductase/coenzyme F420-reducing hydrogenase delta subunit
MNTMAKPFIPPCQAACPIHTDVRGYVLAIARGDIDTAIRINRQVNPFPSVCGRICTHPCETACRRAQVDEAISIASLKRFAFDHAKELNLFKQPENKYNEKIAVIGGGPAGLTGSYYLALLGYKVTIFEAQAVLGGMLVEGIPEYRLPKHIVKKEIEYILSLGIEAKTGLSLGKDFTIEELLRDYNAIFLAIGSQKSLIPKCDGVEIPGVITAVEFLKQISRGLKPAIGKRVVVVGGGHTAVDAARTCLRLGASDVTIIYRRTLEEMPAGRSEIEDAEKEGIKLRYLTSPVKFLCNKAGNLEKICCIEMEVGNLDESGRRRPIPIENSEFNIEADTVILAVGYIPDADVFKNTGILLNKNNTILVSDNSGMTNLKGVFAGGDVVSGPSSVIEAIASGKRTADAIHFYLRGLPKKEAEKMYVIGPLNKKVVGLINKTNRQKMPVLPVDERIKNFEEVELGFTFEQALMESQRCLNCGAGAFVLEDCASCLNCVRICPYGIPSPGEDKVEIDINQCQACGICASECPASAITLNLEKRKDDIDVLQNIMEKVKQENPEFFVIAYYCRYKIPAGLESGKGLYWIGKLCTGRLDISQLLYPFELGADAVAVHTCSNGECRFRDGNKWLLKHVERARNILAETGMGSNRLDLISDDDLHDIRKRFEEIFKNPLKERKKNDRC